MTHSTYIYVRLGIMVFTVYPRCRVKALTSRTDFRRALLSWGARLRFLTFLVLTLDGVNGVVAPTSFFLKGTLPFVGVIFARCLLRGRGGLCNLISG